MKSLQYFALAGFSIFFLFACQSKSPKPDSFEGVIEYAYTYQSDSATLVMLKAERPSSGQMVYKDSLYKSVFIGKNTESFIYNNNTGIAYHLTLEEDSINCEDYKIPTDAVLNWKIIDTDEKILGEPVKILEFSTSNTLNRYHYSLKQKVASFNYDKHLAYNWKFHKELTDGGVLLKVEHIFKKFSITGTATKIEAREVADEDFEIDMNKLKANCFKHR